MARKRSKSGRRARAKQSTKSGKRRSNGLGAFDLPGIDADAVSEFFAAAGEFADEESRLAETASFRLDAPEVGLLGLIACTLDFGPTGTGFLVLPSVEHYRDLTRGAEGRAPRDPSGLSVIFAALEPLPRSIRRELAKLGWAREDRFPMLVKQGPDGKEIAATSDDYHVAGMVAGVMAHVSRTAADVLRSDDQALQCTVGISRFGEVDVLYPGDLDEDELASIVGESIEATVRLPEEAVAAALAVDVLSPRARRVLELARPSASLPVFELRASLEDLAHVGNLLMAASRRPGRPAILDETAMRLLLASELPEPLVNEPPSAMSPLPDVAAARPRGRSGSRVKTKAGKPKRSLYRLKVTLRSIRPPIWRRIEVRSDITLAGLHSAIQDAMGWDDCHLHEFARKGVRYGDSDPGFGGFGDDVLSEKATRLDELLRKPKDSLVYLYDFGDGWEHRVVLEEVEPMPPGKRAPRPRCIGGRRACPPEDCGGPGGYAELLKALRDPRHPEHATYQEWVGGGFDPEAF